LCPNPESLWTVAHQAPLSVGFSRQEYWSGLPFPSPGDLPDPGIKPGSPALKAYCLLTEPPGKPPLWFKLKEVEGKKIKVGHGLPGLIRKYYVDIVNNP